MAATEGGAGLALVRGAADAVVGYVGDAFDELDKAVGGAGGRPELAAALEPLYALAEADALACMQRFEEYCVGHVLAVPPAALDAGTAPAQPGATAQQEEELDAELGRLRAELAGARAEAAAASAERTKLAGELDAHAARAQALGAAHATAGGAAKEAAKDAQACARAALKLTDLLVAARDAEPLPDRGSGDGFTALQVELRARQKAVGGAPLAALKDANQRLG